MCSEQFKWSEVSYGSSTLFFRVWYILEWHIPEDQKPQFSRILAVALWAYQLLEWTVLSAGECSILLPVDFIGYSFHPLLSPLLPLLCSDLSHPLFEPFEVFYSRTNSSCLLTYLLTPWCRVVLEKLTGLQLVKKFPTFHWTRRFITALTSVRHLSLSWASPIQSINPHPTSSRSILILSTHLCLGLPSGLNSSWLFSLILSKFYLFTNWWTSKKSLKTILKFTWKWLNVKFNIVLFKTTHWCISWWINKTLIISRCCTVWM